MIDLSWSDTNAYAETAPITELAPFLDCVWIAHSSDTSRSLVLPDACADLIVDDLGQARFVSTMSAGLAKSTSSPAERFAGFGLLPAERRPC